MARPGVRRRLIKERLWPEVSALSDIDPTAVLDAIGVPDGHVLGRVRGGWDTSIWRVERGGALFALRVFRAGQEEVSRREVAAMRAAATGGVPVPAVAAEGVCDGRPALLLGWCPGRTLIDASRGAPWRAWAIGLSFGETLTRIHATPAPADLASDAEAWLRWAGDAETALCEALRREAKRSTLLHLDYHPLNVMVDGDRVSAVLDWANARAGDPRADLARTIAILRLAPAPPDAPRAFVMVFRRVLEAAFMTGYRRAVGPVGPMDLFYAWAGAGMLRDLAPKVGRDGVWLRESDLELMRRWTAHWKHAAGL